MFEAWLYDGSMCCEEEHKTKGEIQLEKSFKIKKTITF